MGKLPNWLRDENKRKLVGFICTGIAAVVGAGWALFVYLNESKGSIQATYQVCRGEYRNHCPANATWIPCSTTVAEWAKKECASYRQSEVRPPQPGDICGYVVVQIQCTAKQ